VLPVWDLQIKHWIQCTNRDQWNLLLQRSKSDKTNHKLGNLIPIYISNNYPVGCFLPFFVHPRPKGQKETVSSTIWKIWTLNIKVNLCLCEYVQSFCWVCARFHYLERICILFASYCNFRSLPRKLDIPMHCLNMKSKNSNYWNLSDFRLKIFCKIKGFPLQVLFTNNQHMSQYFFSIFLVWQDFKTWKWSNITKDIYSRKVIFKFQMRTVWNCLSELTTQIVYKVYQTPSSPSNKRNGNEWRNN